MVAAVRLAGLSLAVAVTRWFALSKSMWDWDEALFAHGIRDFDVAAYHPHPPGFPLFIGAAKLLPFDEFHALQALAFLASLFVFPAAYFLARELHASEFVAVAAGLLLAFFPNVWFYGGTALSDVPSMVLSLVSCALLLRGCRSDRALLAGAIVLGIAAGVRPQNLLIGFVPFLIAFLCRRRTAIIGAAIVAAIVIASYGAAAAASGGWDVYRETLAHHERYIRETDSFLSPIRPSLLRVADDFFVRPYRAPAINTVVTLLVLVALWRRSPHVLRALAIFGPFCLFAWLYLDFHSASRFSIAYMPLFAILAADGIDAARRGRHVILGGAVLLMIVWMWPALRVVHTTVSPPVAAIDSIYNPQRTIVYVDERLAAHASLLLPDFEQRLVKSIEAPAVMHERARVVLLREGGMGFMRPRKRLERIARNRYFEASVVKARRIEFVEGWSGEEGPVRVPFRWMGRRGRVVFPPGTNTRVSLRIAVPADAVITFLLDGRPLETIHARRGTVERHWNVRSAQELTIETNTVVRAPGDPRELGVRLDWLEVSSGPS